MKNLTSLAACLWAATGVVASKHPKSYSFKPEKATNVWNNDIPVVVNFSESQSASVGGSWWTSSFITGTNKKQYLAVAHYLDTPGYSYFRASTLDLETLDYHQFITLGNGTTATKEFDVKAGDNGIQSLTADNISKQRAYANHENVTFDITYAATSHAVANVGAATFKLGSVINYEWGLPSCETQGSITDPDGRETIIDPANSFTWYDRQWADGVQTAGNWTWFELHIPQTSYKLGIWIIDQPDVTLSSRFATVRGENDETFVLPVKWRPIYERSYRSTAADILYPLDWELDISGFGSLQISSIAEDQEIVGSSALETAYEGFVTLKGTVQSKQVSGYGLVEVVYANWDSL